MYDRPACSLCLHECDERWVGDGTRAFCSGCLVALGRFVSQGAGATRLWPALGVPAIEQSVELLEIWLAADAETHLNLALAYREMGLVADALREAALALQLEAQLTRRQALDALGFLLDQRHLRVGVDVIVVLREALFAN